MSNQRTILDIGAMRPMSEAEMAVISGGGWWRDTLDGIRKSIRDIGRYWRRHEQTTGYTTVE